MKRTLSFFLIIGCFFVSLIMSSSLYLITHANASVAHIHQIGTTSCSKWTTVSSPNPSTGVQSDELLSVAAISTNDAWAVGYRTVPTKDGYSAALTLTEHWNGKQWSVVPSVDPPLDPVLHSVVALSSQNVWAVGNYVKPGPGDGTAYQTLVEHWNGKKWSLVPSPNPFIASKLLYVSAVSANDIWASGTIGDWGGSRIFEHWDGKSWRVAPAPQSTTYTNINGLVAIAANNVWSVGGLMTSLSLGNPLVEHWNGHNWSIVSVPKQAGVLHAITALSANDIWVVGSFAMLHWNGKQWSAVATSATVQGNYGLSSVVASSDSTIWGIGYTEVATKPYDRTLAERWNGRQWQPVGSPNIDLHNELVAATRVPGTSQFWAVGSHGINYPSTSGTANQRTLIMSLC